MSGALKLNTQIACHFITFWVQFRIREDRLGKDCWAKNVTKRWRMGTCVVLEDSCNAAMTVLTPVVHYQE